jgi:hypothetical protein
MVMNIIETHKTAGPPPIPPRRTEQVAKSSPPPIPPRRGTPPPIPQRPRMAPPPIPTSDGAPPPPPVPPATRLEARTNCDNAKCFNRYLARSPSESASARAGPTLQPRGAEFERQLSSAKLKHVEPNNSFAKATGGDLASTLMRAMEERRTAIREDVQEDYFDDDWDM